VKTYSARYRLLELIGNWLVDLGYLCRYTGFFRMARMHTKLIRMKWEVIWDTLQFA
jgi:hypothetical protein